MELNYFFFETRGKASDVQNVDHPTGLNNLIPTSTDQTHLLTF